VEFKQPSCKHFQKCYPGTAGHISWLSSLFGTELKATPAPASNEELQHVSVQWLRPETEQQLQFR